MFRGPQFVVFGPNDEPLWAELTVAANGFAKWLLPQGALQSSSAGDAYVVKCDAESRPQSDIDLDSVNVAVGFAPLKPAEFVIRRLEPMNLQAETLDAAMPRFTVNASLLTPRKHFRFQVVIDGQATASLSKVYALVYDERR